VVVARGRESVVQGPSRFVSEVPPALFQVWEVDEARPDPSDAAALPDPDDEPPLLN
jgi:hypothetical protein